MTETDVQLVKPEDAKVETDSDANGNTEVSSAEAAIIRQLEYYFGDANLAKDKFLKDQITKDNGWVSLEVLLTFKRLKSLSEDKKVIVDAIGKSDEGLIEVSEDREKLRRHPERPLPELNEETRKEIYTRTVYVKGFAPQDGTKMDELVEFFQPYENVKNIVMRKYHDKPTKKYLFKGSVFVTFANKEQCEQLLKTKLTYKGKEMICKMQNDYFEAKQKETKERKEKIEERKRKKEEAKTVATAHLPTGASVSFDGTGEDTTRESIKETIRGFDNTLEVAFIDYQKGDKSGHVRFTEKDAGKRFVEKLTDNKLKIDEAEVTFELLLEEKENLYLQKVVQDQMARRKGGNAKGKGRGKWGGNNNRNFSGNKRRRDNQGDDADNDEGGDEPPVKKVETAAPDAVKADEKKTTSSIPASVKVDGDKK